MKIAVPSVGSNPRSLISSSLGHSPFISFFDDETQEYHFFENMGFSNQDGSGLKAAELIIKNKADTLLTMEIGQKAYSVLIKEHIQIHLLNSPGTIKSIIKDFLTLQV